MDAQAQFDEGELVTLIDRLVRGVPGVLGGRAIARQISQHQESVRGGYDAVVYAVLPFYIQAKTVTFHPKASRSDIIPNRLAIKLNVNPGAFSFPLRKHRGTTEPLQHNALYWLSLRSMTAYVVPNFVSEATLDVRLEEALSVKRSEVWRYETTSIFDVNTGYAISQRARHFHGLLSITPHRLVRENNHRYSFDHVRTPSVAFHSDPENVDGSAPFSEFIEGVLIRMRQGEALGPEELRKTQLKWLEMATTGEAEVVASPTDLLLAGRASGVDLQGARTTRAIIEALHSKNWLEVAAVWDRFLNRKYGIRQYLATESVG